MRNDRGPPALGDTVGGVAGNESAMQHLLDALWVADTVG